MTLREAITAASSDIDRRDAETLLRRILNQPRAWLLAHPDTVLPDDQLSAFRKLVQRRAAQEPLQYITGHQEFFGLDLRVTPAVLIPRPETELLVEAVLSWARELSPPQQDRPLRLIDVGTGSGAIALALAAHLPQASITAVDLSSAALDVAQNNAETLGYESRIHFLRADLLASSDGQDPARAEGFFDAIISNPPYIPDADAPTLQPEVRDHEPHTALFAGPDGLAIYRRLIPQAHAALRPGGLLALEFGFGQRDALAALLTSWKNVRFLNDLAGIPRAALAERP